MKVRDVMTKDVVSIRPFATLKEAAELLVQHRISGLPVVDGDGRVVGVLSEGDILFREREAPEPKGLLARLLEVEPLDVKWKLEAHTAGAAMTAPPVTISPRKAVSEAASVMIDAGVNRLPVVDDEGRLLGIVTRADLVRAFIRSDAEIEREIREDVLTRTLWLSPETIDVEVVRGEVTLSGTVQSQAEAELVPTFVQRVPGVVSVLSKLSWPDDNSHVRRLTSSFGRR